MRKDVFIVRWTPQPFDRGEYSLPRPGELGAAEEHIRQKTAELNAALGLDFNAVEWCISLEGTPIIIDSYNDVPDVRREKLPPAAYDWVVEKFCASVREQAGQRREKPDNPRRASLRSRRAPGLSQDPPDQLFGRSRLPRCR